MTTEERQMTTEQQLTGLMNAAKEAPGRLLTSYSNTDQAALQRLAEQRAAEAAKIAASAHVGITSEVRQP